MSKFGRVLNCVFVSAQMQNKIQNGMGKLHACTYIHYHQHIISALNFFVRRDIYLFIYFW